MIVPYIIIKMIAFSEFILGNPKGSKFSGIIWFTQNDPDDPVKVTINLNGPAKDGLHGLHVHTKNLKNLKKCSTTTVKDCCSLKINNIGTCYS